MLFHLNISSLPERIDQIRLLTDEVDFHVLSLNETLLDYSFDDSELMLNGFSIFRYDRDRHGGGVCLYVKDSLSPTLIKNIRNISSESIWVRITSYHCWLILSPSLIFC